MLRKLTREHAADADDMRAALAAGVSREQIEDALAVCFTFNTIDRLADTFEFFRAGSEVLRCRREVPARAWLPLTMAGSLVSTGPRLRLRRR